MNITTLFNYLFFLSFGVLVADCAFYFFSGVSDIKTAIAFDYLIIAICLWGGKKSD